METVGGYRLVRKLGEGDRAEVWLGHASRHDDRLAAIKLFRETTTDEQIDIELDALTRGDSRHLLRLDDVGAAPDGRPCAILPRLGGSLARTLGSRSSLGVGELVTVAASMVEAVRALRRAGVVHGAISPASVLLDDRGAPVLACFGYARVIGSDLDLDVEGRAGLTPAERDAEPGLQHDLRRLSGMIESFAARAADRHGLRPAAVDDLLGWLPARTAGDLHGDDFLDEFEGRLFELAPAAPIRLEGEPSLRPATTRQIPVATTQAAETRGAPGGTRHLDGTRESGTSRRDWLEGRLAEHIDSSPVAALRSRLVGLLDLSRLRQAIAPVRRPVWVAGGAGLVALLLGMVVVPALGADAGGAARGGVSATPAETARPTVGPGSLRPTLASPTASAPAASAPTASALTATALIGDDPVAAASVLIAERARCLEARDVVCLDGVDQPVSAALESDRYAVRTKTGAAARGAHRLPTAPIALVQVLGDSAIIGLGPPTSTEGAADSPPDTYPASILIVKTTNGWRIRDLTTGVSP